MERAYQPTFTHRPITTRTEIAIPTTASPRGLLKSPTIPRRTARADVRKANAMSRRIPVKLNGKNKPQASAVPSAAKTAMENDAMAKRLPR